jgi:hypothetical protein
MTNTLAYLVFSSLMKEKGFVTILGTELHKNLNHLGLNYKPFYGRKSHCGVVRLSYISIIKDLLTR